MSDEMNVKFSAIKDKDIRKIAKDFDRSFFGNDDKRLSKGEGAELAKLLNGDLKAKLANESEDVKAIFGLSVSTPIERTQATPVVDKANEAIGNAAKKNYSDEVYEAFKKARGYDEKTGRCAKTLKEAYNTVKEQFTDKKKYSKADRKEYEKVLKEIKKGIKSKGNITKAEADNIQRLVYNDYKNDTTSTAAVSYDDTVAKELAYATTASGKVDKRLARNLKGHQGTWLQRGFRAITATVTESRATNHALTAVGNSQAIKNKKYTANELKALLGEEHQALLKEFTDKNGTKYENVLIFAGLVTKDKEGKYDVTNLSNLVRDNIGAEHTLTDDDEPKVAEYTAVWNAIANKISEAAGSEGGELARLYEGSKADVMRSLSSALGYYDDKAIKMTERVVKRAEGDALKGAVIGGTAAGVVSRNLEVNQDQTVNIRLEGTSEEAAQEMLRDIQMGNRGVGATLQLVNGIFNIRVHQSQLVKLNKLVKNIAIGAGIGALINAAMGTISEMRKHSREFDDLLLKISCCDLSGKTPEEAKKALIAQINNYHPEVTNSEEKKALKLLVEFLGYQKDSKGEYVLDKDCNPIWDVCTFQKEFERIGGNQKENKLEIKFAGWDAQNAADAIKAKQENCEPKIEEPKKEKSSPEILWAEEITEEYNMNVKGYSWDRLSKLYDCFPTNNKNKSIRMLKIMQGMNGTKLTVEQISELADISRKEVAIHYKRQNGKVVTDKFGNPIFDVEDAAKQLQKAFANFKFPEGYKFNYTQCAKALCSRVPGDNKNEIIAPTELSYEDGRTCNKQNVNKPKASHDKAEVGDRGKAGKVGTSENAVKDADNAVQHNVSDKVLDEAKKKGKRDQGILQK